jgi:hypothetical protein
MDKHESSVIMKCHDHLLKATALLTKLSNEVDAEGAGYGRWLLIRQIESTLHSVATELRHVAKAEEPDSSNPE